MFFVYPGVEPAIFCLKKLPYYKQNLLRDPIMLETVN